MATVKNMSSIISKEWLIEQIDNSKFLTHIAAEVNCSKDTISRLLKKYELREYYDTKIKNKNQVIKFRIRNPELRKALEKYGPLHNVVD